MVAQVPDRRTGRLAGAVGIALLLAGLTLLLEPAPRRAGAAALLAVGLAVGVVVALRLPASGRLRTPMERLNDGAFVVVVAAISLVAVRLARPWTAALPGLVGGILIGLTLRPHPSPLSPPPPGPAPGPTGPGPTGPGRPGHDPRSRPRRNPTSRCRAPRRGTVAHRRNLRRRLSTPPAPRGHRPAGPAATNAPAGRQVRSRITTGMSRRVLRW